MQKFVMTRASAWTVVMCESFKNQVDPKEGADELSSMLERQPP